MMMSVMWAFFVRLLPIVRSKSQLYSYFHIVLLFGSKFLPTLANDIRSSPHFSLFNCTLFLRDQSTTSSAMVCELLCSPLAIISEAVVPSTYFLRKALFRIKSLIIIRNNYCPNLVPSGTPEGTEHHSETLHSESGIL